MDIAPCRETYWVYTLYKDLMKEVDNYGIPTRLKKKAVKKALVCLERRVL